MVNASRKIPVGPQRDFEFRTAVPAPTTGEGFRVVGEYKLIAGEQTLKLPVSQAMIDSGAIVQVEWSDENEE